MSQSVRQNRLFAAEDWQAIYRSFQNIDFTAYDFDTLRNALIDYVRTQYPEDFNDYIESSEFVAIIELLAYLGTSLSFRHDLNSRENFLDTAERRDSIVRLARMLSYVPKRNIPTSGLFKLSAVQTNQQVTDSLGRNLSNTTVFWNDPNNPDALEQFTTIMNAAFDPAHTFGRPFKSGSVGGIPTDLYRFTGSNPQIAYNVSIPIRGEKFPFDIVNPDFGDNQFFFERHPDPADSFHIIYRNDGEGLGSSNTGFFMLFKQGTLQSIDHRYDIPLRNRTTDININNINEADVYVQEIDQAGAVLSRWRKVPALVGTNVIYNSLNNQLRNIFTVLPRLNDQITLKFADGNFGDVPTGIFRTWVRTSANRKIVLRPEDVRNYEIVVPYIGADNQSYRLRLIFTLEETVANGEPAETNAQIKERAPQVFYTQNRMVNGEDYNVFPLTRGNEILKLKAINRSHAGHSRYIDINDPTGTFQNVLVFGDDGALYYDEEPDRVLVSGALETEDIVTVSLQTFVNNPTVRNFFYSIYYQAVLDDDPTSFTLPNFYWETGPKNTFGNFGFYKPNTSVLSVNSISLVNEPGGFIKPGALVRFENASNGISSWAAVRAVINGGQPFDPEDPSEIGPIELNTAIERNSQAFELMPAFRTQFTDAEAEMIEDRINLQADFGIGYDLRGNNLEGEWYIVPGTPNGDEDFVFDTAQTASWIIFASYNAADNNWSFVTRGKRYIFESYEDVRFYFDPTKSSVDVETGQPLFDTVEILRSNTTSNSNPTPIGTDVIVQPSRLFIYEDGHQDPRKVQVVPPDSDADGLADDPLAIELFLQGSGPEDVFLERFTDFDGYEYFRLWKGGKIDFKNPPGPNLPFTVDEVDGEWFIVRGTDYYSVLTTGLIIDTVSSAASIQTTINSQASATLVEQINGLVIYNNVTGEFNKVEAISTSVVNVNPSNDFLVKQGRTFEQDTNKVENPLYFKLKHYAPRDNRVDPSISNIVDMMILTNTYYRDLIVWKNSNDVTAPIPQAPTTEQLRIQFSELNQYKMLSDQIIFKPGKFKILFGTGAAPELRARFKVVKMPNVNVTDNEIRSGVIRAIDEYFNIANWDFGESFFYTELSTYIHQRLANFVASVVIVPQKEESVFGNLFQVRSEADELFLSSATVSDVEIVRNLTETNLRVSK